MSAETINAYAQVALGAAALVGAVGGLLQYRSSRAADLRQRERELESAESAIRIEATQWMSELYRLFYLDSEMTGTRLLIENMWATRIDPIVQKFLWDPVADVSLDGLEAEDENRLTNLLNFLEYLLYLRGRGRIPVEDIDKLFGYWLRNWLRAPRYASFRVYLAVCDYELLAAEVGTVIDSDGQPTELSLVAVYGTLKKGECNNHYLRGSEYVGTGRVRGQLYQVSFYPALAASDDHHSSVEVYRVDGPTLAALDGLEELRPGDPNSEYVRWFVPVYDFEPVDGSREVSGAWVYLYNRPTDSLVPVEGEDWTGSGGC